MKQGSFSNCKEISPELEKPYNFVSEKKMPRETLKKNLNLLKKGAQKHLCGNNWSNSGGSKDHDLIAEMSKLFLFVVHVADIR